MDEAELAARLDRLRDEHRELDSRVATLAGEAIPDQLELARLKRRKLRLRDEIAVIGDRLIPDIIA